MVAIDKEALKVSITEAMRPVQDPEMGIGIVDLGLIYDIDIDDDASVTIKMTLTTPACPYGDTLIGLAKLATEQVKEVTRVEMVIVWDPIWNPEEMCSDLAKDQLGIW